MSGITPLDYYILTTTQREQQQQQQQQHTNRWMYDLISKLETGKIQKGRKGQKHRFFEKRYALAHTYFPYFQTGWLAVPPFGLVRNLPFQNLKCR